MSVRAVRPIPCAGLCPKGIDNWTSIARHGPDIAWPVSRADAAEMGGRDRRCASCSCRVDKRRYGGVIFKPADLALLQVAVCWADHA